MEERGGAGDKSRVRQGVERVKRDLYTRAGVLKGNRRINLFSWILQDGVVYRRVYAVAPVRLTALLLQLDNSPRTAIVGRHFATDICNDYTGRSIDVHVPGFKIVSFLFDWGLRQRDNPAYAVIEGKYDQRIMRFCHVAHGGNHILSSGEDDH